MIGTDRIARPRGALAALPAALLAAAALCALPAPAAADDAQKAYKKGVSLFEDGEYAEAAAAFRQAYDLKPSWKLLYNIGQCEAAAKRYGHALAAFEQYLVEAGDDIDEVRRGEVMKEIERLRPLVGMIEIQAPAGAEIAVDDEPVGTAPLPGPLRVSAKTHRVVVTVGGEVKLDQQVAVPGASTVKVDATERPAEPAPAAAAEPAPASAPAPAPADEDGLSKLQIAGIVTGAVGLAGVGVGAFFTVKGNKDYAAYKDAAAEGDADAYATYKNDTIPADKVGVVVSFAVAGALIATSATLFILDAVGEKSDAPVAVLPAPGGLAVRF